MYEVDFSKPIHIHFIGIGGISMSGLAEILLKENFTISGSDAKESDLTRHLTSLGAQVFYGQKAENIIPGIDLVVYTAAIHPDNPEFAAAKAAGIPMLTRAELLGQIMRNYNTPIAVSGTHGKTTTTSMLSHILMAADCDPTISVGGILPSIGGNIRVGHSETFLTEACEYTNSFLSFFPKIGIILNMDADHLDFFKDIDDIRHSFREFARLLPADGMLIINADTPKYDYVTEGLGCKIVTYALENQSVADYTAANITYDEFDHPSFDCICRGELRGRYTLMVPGLHNVSNALAAIALADELQLPENAINALADFIAAGDVTLDAVAARCADPAIADDLKYVLATANAMAAGRYQVAYCPSLVRGQGYYTGMVFEITCPQFSGAVAGGGRYDNMVGKFLGTQVPAVGFSIGFERVCGILLEQGYQIPGAKQKIALLYGKDADFTAVLSKAAALRDTYNVTVLPQGKKLGKQLGQLEAAGFAGAAFMDKDEVKVFAAQ